MTPPCIRCMVGQNLLATSTMFKHSVGMGGCACAAGTHTRTTLAGARWAFSLRMGQGVRLGAPGRSPVPTSGSGLGHTWCWLGSSWRLTHTIDRPAGWTLHHIGDTSSRSSPCAGRPPLRVPPGVAILVGPVNLGKSSDSKTRWRGELAGVPRTRSEPWWHVSVPEPPLSASLPPFPWSRSGPPPPRNVSFPAAPDSTSCCVPPSSWSTAAPPLSASRPCPP